MQLRTFVIFQKVWQEASYISVVCNCSSFVPHLEAQNEIVIYATEMPSGLWRPERFLYLILGEMLRLRDDERGYGLRG